MLHDIKIYGEISNSSGKKGYCGLVDVQNQLEQADGKPIRVRINSIGGDVDEGFAIYSELRKYASEHNVRVTTLTEGRCASIATVIFLAGDERIVSKYVDPFIHNAWTEFAGSSKEFAIVQKELANTDSRIAQHYADHTLLSYEEALQLMGNDTSLKPDECVKLRFATRVESVARPMALKKALGETREEENFKPKFDMNTKNKSERRRLLNQIKKVLGFSNKLVFTADSKEIDFYELGEDEVVEAGAKATIDGQPANGEYTVPDVESGKAKKYVFESGILTEIVELEDESTEDVEALKAELEALKAEKANAESEIETLNKEVESVTEVMAKLKETYDTTLAERNTFKAKADSLELKIKNAKGATFTDLKHDEGKETKTEKYNAGIAKTANINLNKK